MYSNTFRRAFEADLERDGLAAAAPDPQSTWNSLRALWDRRERVQYVASARAMHARGGLKRSLGDRLAVALMDMDLSAEALEVLQSPVWAAEAPDVEHARLLATLLLERGEPAQARRAFETALSLGLAEADPDKAQLLAGAIGLIEGGAAADSWPRARDIARGCLRQDMGGAAAACLTAAFRARPIDPEAFEEAAMAAFAALRLADGDVARALLGAMSGLYERAGLGAIYRGTLEVMDGAPDLLPAPPADQEPGPAWLGACLAQACAAAGLWRAAVRRFATGISAPDFLHENLCELARASGEALLEGVDLRFRSDGPPRVFDLFSFNGEFQMLQLKLQEMGPWVDHFVIVEAATTFTGRPKPLHFQNNREAFKAFDDKIVYVTVEDSPDYLTSTWAREFYQKDSVVRGMSGLAAPDDLVILSDVDEIVRRPAIEGFSGAVAPAALRTFKYFLNCEMLFERPQLKPAVTRARHLQTHGWNYLRLGAVRFGKHSQLPDAGWHFTSVGPPEWLAEKMKNTAHEQWAYQDSRHFEKMLRRLRQGALGAEFALREIDDSFPAYVRANQDALAEMILKKSENPDLKPRPWEPGGADGGT